MNAVVSDTSVLDAVVFGSRVVLSPWDSNAEATVVPRSVTVAKTTVCFTALVDISITTGVHGYIPTRKPLGDPVGLVLRKGTLFELNFI